MSAYPSAEKALPTPIPLRAGRCDAASQLALFTSGAHELDEAWPGASLIDALVDELARRVAAAVATQLGDPAGSGDDEWLDTRRAAEYLGVHRDTLRKLAAERAVPAEQDGPGCKLFFRRGDLDEWRRSGGRSSHLLSVLPNAA
jgi:excisionase family DNA binding protein